MNIFITGGTSGIGQELAKRYLTMGHRVGICGRRAEKSLLSPSPALHSYSLDVRDKGALMSAVRDFSQGELDLMIIAAGTYTESILHHLSPEESAAMLQTNIGGTLNALEVARELMLPRQRGHIAAIASVSALLDFPQSSLYSKTKKSVLNLCEAYRAAMAPNGITVTAIAPGYVDTPKLRELNHGNLSAKPCLITCEQAATHIIAGIEQGKELLIFPPGMKRLITLLSLLPGSLQAWIMKTRARREYRCR